MMPRLPGWEWQQHADSALVTLGQEAVRYIDRATPIASIDELVRRHSVDYRDSRVIGVPERLVTDEGERAALVTLEATLAERPVRRALAFVLADDWYAYIGGISFACDSVITEIVRELVCASRLQLGVRRRRYGFEAPAGWRPLEIGRGIAHFLADDDERAPSRISVYPAVPNQNGTTIDVQRMIGEDLVVDRVGPSSGFVVEGQVASEIMAAPLHGTRWQLAGKWRDAPVEREIVVLRDGVYAYSAELVSTPEKIAGARAAFEAVVASIEAVPAPKRQSAQAFAHWAD